MASWFLSRAASTDIDGAWGYIQERNPKAADRVVAEFYRTFETLAENPNMGRLRTELEGTPRSFPLSGRPYVVFYRPVSGGVRIIRIIHASQDLEQTY